MQSHDQVVNYTYCTTQVLVTGLARMEAYAMLRGDVTVDRVGLGSTVKRVT